MSTPLCPFYSFATNCRFNAFVAQYCLPSIARNCDLAKIKGDNTTVLNFVLLAFVLCVFFYTLCNLTPFSLDEILNFVLSAGHHLTSCVFCVVSPKNGMEKRVKTHTTGAHMELQQARSYTFNQFLHRSF